ncbi:polysaccharide biosynthesis/export family protein [Paracoccus sp. (in: a-proteobacteria)]|uniref:polysaccharide biosynthesis/export family protein n=1 Tax=Paracoccus sp. TaxID=267 RepID=UPI0026E0B029|nr:polysaccharide biosynthesis/export family protein [Paracoccus sp. (in: a-proteobacteria)]MDO5369602.1 polysaccharide biosynthesis/export family protein [Paracoccus sp. (in: a-proteobacteria)]
MTRLIWPLLLLLAAVAPAQAQDHVIASGETLEISVFRVPELTREAVVDVDGQIAFPPLGRIAVAGKTTEDVAALLQDRMSGLEIMLDAQVTVGLAAVRPVVIGGDVAQPGAIPFQRGMTVRRAIAMAGGLGALRPSPGAAAELRAEGEAIAAELLARHATLARARAELDGAAQIAAADLPRLAGNEDEAVLALANRLLAAANAESEAEKAFYARDIAMIDTRIARLKEQIEHQRALVEQQIEEVTRYTDMQGRGLTPQTRVSEEYRTLNELRGNLSEVEASIADVERQRETVAHELDRHDARRTAALEAEAQEALAAIAALNARMNGVAGQLSQLGAGGMDAVEVTLYRAADGQETPAMASEDTVLQPGDLIEVDLPDSFFGMLPSANAVSADPASVPQRSVQPSTLAQQRPMP